MYIFLLVVHTIIAFLLIAIVLIQRGRGGGLVESFSGVESMFGTKTSAFLTRTTAVLATLFLITSISLAVLAARQGRSLIREEAISSREEQQTADTQALSPGSPEEQKEAAEKEKLPD
ncbi:MAG: preprotein translocase subunit SecG [Candidatus Omnitrophica bacterium]|nr:preprotein translocase subunit SecG [Candidatus Omnitrophota bacterium]MBU1871229.1 preprotein translocase subunit SecG [Candidatus Omnitrophota bacterium]